MGESGRRERGGERERGQEDFSSPCAGVSGASRWKSESHVESGNSTLAKKQKKQREREGEKENMSEGRRGEEG